ncbi:MAG: glyoxalase [Phenylobacterium sp.]|jgi:catechol 2,3-dioxygenase-like lactoylglutathione lyase family enzyme|uniref:VOC family protein n=1 Tax=Phenylobacterium sp. TaxID=1871053 RepID=UPI0025E77C75|nr:VOC family protein [Phenylobacterium sp.]MBA4013717.1 glyoxalase [Phenylobacterium sp.]
MIGYTTVGANDFEKSKAFFDAVLAPLGVARSFGMDRIQFYGAPGAGALAVCKPYDGEKATIGNGMMVALACPSHEVVDQVHAAALAAGGACDGEPGKRLPTFYGAYFRDLDGNKFCAFKMG